MNSHLLSDISSTISDGELIQLKEFFVNISSTMALIIIDSNYCWNSGKKNHETIVAYFWEKISQDFVGMP